MLQAYTFSSLYIDASFHDEVLHRNMRHSIGFYHSDLCAGWNGVFGFWSNKKRPPGGDLFIYTLHYPSLGIFKGNACLASAGARPVTDATRRFSRRACHVAAGVVGSGMVNSFANFDSA